MRTPYNFLAALLFAIPASATVKNPGTLVYAAYWDVDSLDPDWAQNMSPLYNIYEGLVDFQGGGFEASDLVPRLATIVPTRANGLISTDGLLYRFPIRKGVRFHDGSTLTPEDVRYSLLRFMLGDRSGGPSTALLLPITGLNSTRGEDGKPLDKAYARAAAAVTVSGNEVSVRLNRPFAPLLGILANFGRVVSRRWCAAQGQWDGTAATWKTFNNPSRQDALPMEKANGTGPFQLERYEKSSGQIVFKRHESYWRAPARLARVVQKTVPDFTTRKLMLAAGDADVIVGSSLYDRQLADTPGVEVARGLIKLQSPTFLAFNFAINPEANAWLGSGKLDGEGIPPDFFADKDVRLAFAHSFDAKAYLRDVLKNEREPADGFLPPGMPGASAALPRPVFDLGKATEHFRKARGGRVWEKGFLLHMVCLLGDENTNVQAHILKKGIESVNPRFQVVVHDVQNATYVDLLGTRKIPAAFRGWTADYPDPHDFAFAIMHSEGAIARRFGYANHQADALVEKAVAEQDSGKRAALYGRLQHLFAEDLPYVPIAFGSHSRIQRAWVKGFVFNPAVHGEPYDSIYYDLYKAEANQ